MHDNPFSLEGKSIFITGASSGIGRASAILVSKMGADVIITGRNEERLNETFALLDKNKKNKKIITELTDDDSIKNLLENLCPVDGVLLCAGKGITLPFQFATREKLDEIFNINFFGQIELLRLLYKKKLIKKGGSVVTIASLGGTKVFSGANGIYGSSKAALDSMMKFCAKEFAPRMIRVNCICPGMVDTPLIHRGTLTEEQLQQDKERYLLKRYGNPEDIANGVVYLLSDASSWMTGQDLILDGGVSVQ